MHLGQFATRRRAPLGPYQPCPIELKIARSDSSPQPGVLEGQPVAAIPNASSRWRMAGMQILPPLLRTSSLISTSGNCAPGGSDEQSPSNRSTYCTCTASPKRAASCLAVQAATSRQVSFTPLAQATGAPMMRSDRRTHAWRQQPGPASGPQVGAETVSPRCTVCTVASLWRTCWLPHFGQASFKPATFSLIAARTSKTLPQAWH